MPASFDGIPLGIVTTVIPQQNPSRFQVNEYPGVPGRERLKMGTSGGNVTVKALLYADNAFDLGTLESVWYAYQTTSALLTFSDPYLGNLTVFLELYEPTSGIGCAGDGGSLKEAVFHFTYDT